MSLAHLGSAETAAWSPRPSDAEGRHRDPVAPVLSRVRLSRRRFHRLTLTARDAAGNRSRPVRQRLRVI
jgi:hypothetical protein